MTKHFTKARWSNGEIRRMHDYFQLQIGGSGPRTEAVINRMISEARKYGPEKRQELRAQMSARNISARN